MNFLYSRLGFLHRHLCSLRYNPPSALRLSLSLSSYRYRICTHTLTHTFYEIEAAATFCFSQCESDAKRLDYLAELRVVICIHSCVYVQLLWRERILLESATPNLLVRFPGTGLPLSFTSPYHV